MNIGNLICGFNSVSFPNLIHYDSLLRNAINIITKCDSYFITVYDRSLLQNATVLLQNATDITSCNNSFKKCDSY